VLTAVIVILGAYLWAGIPSAYLAGRYVKGIDIRQYGSGTVGTANVLVHVGRWPGVLVSVFDCLGKGALPVIVAKLLDQSLGVQAGVGLAAIAAHNWSPYLRFTGGRGVATAVGVVFGFQMIPELFVLTALMGIVGRYVFHETAFWTLVSMLALPALTLLFGRETEIFYMSAAIPAILVAKRLTANWDVPSREYSFAKVMAYRVLWDRDVREKVSWTERRPPTTRE
jgi:glycerol-3-phosphate acyltransferase PlsY